MLKIKINAWTKINTKLVNVLMQLNNILNTRNQYKLNLPVWIYKTVQTRKRIEQEQQRDSELYINELERKILKPRRPMHTFINAIYNEKCLCSFSMLNFVVQIVFGILNDVRQTSFNNSTHVDGLDGFMHIFCLLLTS